MKKIFKGIAVLAATAALGTSIAFAAGCGGKDGKYVGTYSYPNPYATGHYYGIAVEVTVENNIITRVEDITKSNPDTKDWVSVSAANPSYGWTEDSVANWNDNEEWLLAQYEGWSVADILAIDAYVKTGGEPYSVDKNGAVEESGLLISGSTQGSVRLLLAIQDALGKTTTYGRVHKGE